MKNKTLNYATLIILLIAFPLAIVGYFKSGKPITNYTYIGLAIMIPAFILLAIARLQLGSSFQVSAAANELITKGLYKRFRHPIYYSGILLLIGLGIFLQDPTIFILCAVIIFLQL